MLIQFKHCSPEFDLYRVDDIRTQLDDNSYNVDSQQIADKIIDLEVALAG